MISSKNYIIKNHSGDIVKSIMADEISIADFVPEGHSYEEVLPEPMSPDDWELHKIELAEAIRHARNNLLQQTDWTQLSDAPIDQAEWATYRQALRDITKQSGFPLEVIWPNKPQ
jgi:hypothetical protein